MEVDQKEKVAVIVGSGLVGKAWAILFARAGFTVRLYDTVQRQLESALSDVEAKLRGLEAEALLNSPTASVLSRITTHSDIALAMAGNVIHVQECVPESLQMKKDVFTMLDSALLHSSDPQSVVLASSTSNIPASQFCADLKHKEQCIVAHPINPPHLIPLVEVVPAPFTSDAVTQRTLTLIRSIGQKPVLVKKEVPGFALNRLQYAVLLEAFSLVEDGVLSPQDLDTVMTDGLAMRWNFMGPFQTIDLNAPQGVQDYCNRYLEGMYNVTSTQDSTRRIQPDTVSQVDAAMRSKYPADQIPDATRWRDQRLVQFVKHRLAAQESVDPMFPQPKQ